ncbi:MAG: AAA family ATPase [Spirochaetales bacterium]|nr:AAA family ATPase [Spirochaetales bacterium]
MILNENSPKKIIPVAGGKGGVGKSVLSTNLSLLLAVNGKKTIVVDLDLGGSNLHTMLGIKNTNRGIGNFISDKSLTMDELVVPTDYENLYLIPGDVLVYGLGEISFEEKKRIIKGLVELDADYIILDLGAGSSLNVIDFFLISNSGIVVTTPHMTSIMNAFGFLKNVAFRFLQRAFADNKRFTEYFDRAFLERHPGEQKSLKDMLDELRSIEPEAVEKAELFLEILQPKIIMNMAEESGELSIAESLRDLTKRSLSIHSECLGLLFMDRQVSDALKERTPFIMQYPESVTAEGMDRMARKIILSKRFPEMPLELDYYKDSFELTQIEAEIDEQAREKAENSGYSPDEIDNLLKLVEQQQMRIRELEKALSRSAMGGNQGGILGQISGMSF